MPEKLKFSKITKEDIFCDSFKLMTTNNEIEFSGDGISVLYAPNGVGKTSFANVLGCKEGCEFEVTRGGRKITQANKDFFHVINDQNSRNIIKGNTEDFLLGDDIRNEYILQRYIESEFSILFGTKLANSLKAEFNISKKTSKLLNRITDLDIKEFVKEIANMQSKGKGIDYDAFLKKIQELKAIEIPTRDEKKYAYLISDFENAKSVISEILSIKSEEIKQNNNVQAIDEHEEAIKILDKFSYKDECIVCDSEIDSKELLSRKKGAQEIIYKSLDKKTKDILEKIIKSVKGNDPFCIEDSFMKAILNGDISHVEKLKKEIEAYFNLFNQKINNLFFNCLEGSKLYSKFMEYKTMLERKPQLTEEEILFIEKVVNESIEKDIKLIRDTATNNLKLVLGGKEFLNEDRSNMHLSNGEQNFISLSFELLKAKNSAAEIVVLDDPISSFDSIYKNKIAFSIIKFLENKDIIVLTHNTELIRLMEHQKQKCFFLYLFNNTENEENGFIQVNNKEQDILLYIDKLLNLFRTNIWDEVKDPKNFLLSMIPFMRGYCQITDDKESKNKLTKLMHGYETESINLTEVYNHLFGQNGSQIETIYETSALEITNMDIDDIEILREDSQYQLLNKTLIHTLSYLYLRLKVEKSLVDKFAINTKKNEMLSQIIFQSFKGNDIENKHKRVFLASKKTLLNEFNHFEGNMNIFQPAIDISDSALKKEKKDIISFLENM